MFPNGVYTNQNVSKRKRRVRDFWDTNGSPNSRQDIKPRANYLSLPKKKKKKKREEKLSFQWITEWK